MPRMAPVITALTVNSGILAEAGMNGSNFEGVSEDMWCVSTHAREPYDTSATQINFPRANQEFSKRSPDRDALRSRTAHGRAFWHVKRLRKLIEIRQRPVSAEFRG